MSKIYEIDPEADTLIVIPPLENFAAWPKTSVPNTSSKPKTNGTVTPSRQITGANGVNGTSGFSGLALSPTSPTSDVRIKVSSKHLSLASPRFRDLLTKATPGSPSANGKLFNGTSSPASNFASTLWRNSKDAASNVGPTPADGRTHLVLDGIDPRATIVVLNILHCRTSKNRVPKTVSLETLARIAVVVDRFKLQDAVDLYAERWLDGLYSGGDSQLLHASVRDLMLWIYVAYVFGHNDLFKAATRLAAAESTGPLPTLPHLPLRAKIVHDIDVERQAVVMKALDVVETAVHRLLSGDVSADEDADEDEDQSGRVQANSDTFLLGSLLRTMHSAGVYGPRPQAPYEGVSVAAISQAAHEVQTQVWRMAFRVGDTTRSNRTNNRLQLTPKLDSLRASVAGLDLTSEHGYSLY